MKPITGKCYITQGYGATDFARSVFGQKAYKNFGGIHPGIDWGTGGINAPTVSTIAGKIVRASMDGGWGNHVEIQGSDGWNRQYGHLQSISVKIGDTVIPGQEIGKVGTTGASTGIHLHYGNRRRKMFGGWEYRDPSNDFQDMPVAVMPTSKLIKQNGESGVYVFNGKAKFGIPDWPTKVFLFGDGDDNIEEVEADILTKIPTLGFFPSLK